MAKYSTLYSNGIYTIVYREEDENVWFPVPEYPPFDVGMAAAFVADALNDKEARHGD